MNTLPKCQSTPDRGYSGQPAPVPANLELVTMGREWLSGAPEGKPGPKDLQGFSGPVGMVCSPCAGRIVARGCSLRTLADVPVWRPAIVVCALCGNTWRD